MLLRRQSGDDWLAQRRRMIEEQIRSRGVQQAAVLEAMLAVPREIFVPESVRSNAYTDRALLIGHGQTISQPYIVAFMTEKLEIASDGRILEIGTGTGYQTSILAKLCKTVYTVERIEALQRQAVDNFARLGITNIDSVVGDGSVGLDDRAPFDRIIVTAAAPSVPKTLVNQLKSDGFLVAPVGESKRQTLVRVIRDGPRIVETSLLACRFVKLVGAEGWSDEEA